MSKLLPGSSEPSESEILKIQKQCDLVREENRIDTVDTQDQAQCEHWLKTIESSKSHPRFSNIECLGLGAYGLVFAVNDRAHQKRRVAIKILRPSKASQRIPKDRFEFEGQVLGEIKHPNVIELLESGQFDGVPYHIVQLADVGSLAQLISSNGCSVSPEQAAWLVSKLADALEEAHSLAILHRDIKPGNVLLQACDPLDSQGLGLWPLLTDFGLSKKLDHSPAEPLTNYGEIIGTLSYMSPEQVQGQAMRTPSDIFSLGVILSELVYGVHPFVDRSHFHTLTNIVQKAPQVPVRNDYRIPSALKAIIAKCLHKGSRERYRSARDLAEDLRRFLNGEPISLAPPNPWQSLTQWIKNHPKTTVFLGTLFASVLGGGLLLAREWRIQRDMSRDKAKANELFLESMRVPNSSMNDVILAGNRVPKSLLLENINLQLPLLEEARRLVPDDLKLTNYLQVMYHYQSLSSAAEAVDNHEVDEQQMFSQAIQARERSLEIIQELIEKQPDVRRHRIANINGLFNLSHLTQQASKPDEISLEWNSKGIDAAEKFLVQYPNDLDISETLFNLQLERANLLKKMEIAPDQALELYKRTAESSLELFKQNQERTGLLVNYIETVSAHGRLLMKMGKKEESVEVFLQMDKVLSTPSIAAIDDWLVLERSIWHYLNSGASMLQYGCYRELVALTYRWEAFLSSPIVRTLPDPISLLEPNNDMGKVIPKYLRWLAFCQINPGSSEEVSAKRDAQNAFYESLEKTGPGMVRVLGSIKKANIPVEAFYEWMELREPTQSAR
jgi:serine/threonine protein kinase